MVLSPTDRRSAATAARAVACDRRRPSPVPAIFVALVSATALLWGTLQHPMLAGASDAEVVDDPAVALAVELETADEPSGPYLLHPAADLGEALDVLDGSLYSEANAIVYKLDGTDTQTWTIERREDIDGSPSYAIVNAKSGRLLAVDLSGVFPEKPESDEPADADVDDAADGTVDVDDDAASTAPVPTRVAHNTAPATPSSAPTTTRPSEEERIVKIVDFELDGPNRGPMTDGIVALPQLDLDGANVCQQVDHEITEWVTNAERLAQRWRVVPIGNGSYRISPVLDELSALTVVRGKQKVYSDAELVRTVSTHFIDAQWSLEPSRAPQTQASMVELAQSYDSPTEYLILVDTTHHYLGMFYGEKGSWDLVRYCSCGNGAYGTPSPIGTFSLGNKGYYFDSEDGARCFYFSQIWGSYLIHSTLYWPWSENPDYTMDPTLGAYESHGCIRVDLADAFYVNRTAPRGTTIVLY